ncbi:MAG TPA: 2-amino-4-hydroxy-6-hydroxymethyldihydropteridine diphosphokinase [Proteiniphilum sp.]|nr:2-amino-4-hydroxy-6-hydroxymethyldihydropteridine diphosphokinase [Proteiniphilum sp.]HPD87422.1 2-amino-4-hydroxy-6-hydroxymethyldihydropteridine diphosphokinase [Proteiniphilum sp.]HPJ49725.1 2-amino-4-hydroxy-6-hydroxymethyldihydropteridine diphosphokinase [Proteiniphilum sp.]HPR19239.1 2-amino-4-hydroxy-6-hydroxymethyldihydropteridine diphosphokinase [Proteiniphilum sp.]
MNVSDTGTDSLFLALGSNLGDREHQIHTALRKIEARIGRIISLSALYHTRPEGFDSPNEFVNCVCEVDSRLDIYTIFAITQNIEVDLGRVKKSVNGSYADRLIDIDLIMAGDMILDTPLLTLPHPRFHRRDFVLTPLCEIAPDLVHPVLGKTIRQLKDELPLEETDQ